MRRIPIKNRIFILPLFMLLSSCAEMNTQFDCPMTSGLRCESIDSVNARINRGEIGRVMPRMVSANPMQTMPMGKNTISPTPSYSGKGNPLRVGETVQRVWIAPFEDKEGNYHQESDIYTVTKSGSWRGASLKIMNEEGA